MKALVVIALLVSLVAVVNTQTAQQEQCAEDFFADNLSAAGAILQACGDLVRN